MNEEMFPEQSDDEEMFAEQSDDLVAIYWPSITCNILFAHRGCAEVMFSTAEDDSPLLDAKIGWPDDAERMFHSGLPCHQCNKPLAQQAR